MLQNVIYRSIRSTFSRYDHSQFKKCLGCRLTSVRGIVVPPKTIENMPQLTMQEVSDRLINIMGIEKGFKTVAPSRTHLLQYVPKSQADLPPRSMQDSFTSAIIPLSRDVELQDKYITFLGHVRIGRLLEDMDLFAVWVAQQHLKNPNLKEGVPFPYTLVTALVDKIDFTDYKPLPNLDIRLSGHVSWVGTSSIEVVVWLEQERHSQWHKLTRALFLMAARDTTNTKAAPVNPLVTATEKENEIFSGGEKRKKHRFMLMSQSLRKVIPNEEEQQIIHELFLRTVDTNDESLAKRVLPQGCAWMGDSSLSTVIFSHPENRNLHNKVFGGFLMRNAVELSWALCYLFSKYRPQLKHISDIRFHKPVDVNSLIKFHAHVVYTHVQYVQITVYAEAFDAKSGAHSTTNAFHFTFELPEVATEVVPVTYHEAMMYLDGRRHFSHALEAQFSDLHSKL